MRIMKVFKYLFGLMLVGLLLPACEKDLELFPLDQKIPAFDRIQDFEEALVGAYGSWIAGGAYGGSLITVDAWLGDDMVISPQNNGQGAFLHNWTYSDGDGTMSGIWARLYRGISRCNLILENQGNISDPLMPQIVAESKVLRAWGHLELFKVFAERYGDGSAMAVPYVTSTSIIETPARIGGREYLDLVEKDLVEALADLGQPANILQVGPTFVEGLLARVAMYRGDWNDVINHTTNAITTAPPLANEAVYANMWNGNEVDGENIFKLKFTTGDGEIGGNFWVISLNAPYFNPSSDIYDEYGYGVFSKSADVRYREFFVPGVETDPLARVEKYWNRNPSSTQPNLADFKVMRTSEMYLLRAEAYFNSNNESAAKADLDAVRAARIGGYVSLPETGEQVRDGIRLERRLELCYEGFRVFDLKRWNLGIERDHCTAVNCTLPADCYILVFPIPQDELFANPLMEQNPGWATSEPACYQ